MTRTAAALVTTALIILAGTCGCLQLPSGNEPDRPLEEITVAYSPFESGALFWIAEDQGYFRQNGLNLTLKKYDSGAEALTSVVNGEADITIGVTEYPLVWKAFEGARLRAIANIDKGNFIYIVARKDRIGNVSDLRGKRVGTTVGTVAEFHLGRFLTLHGIDRGEITIVDVRTPAGWVSEVVDGNVDAISTAQPYAREARDRLGGNAFFWPAQSSQPLFALVISTDEWVAAHPDEVEGFLEALVTAEEYAVNHPEEAKQIVQERLNLDPAYMEMVWSQNQFAVTLDQSLVLAMEDEARWMIANNLTNETEVPDFRDYISVEGLDTVKPGSVNIIG
jgi:NitT/TauT family transport system substrate-binding protein